jgi:glutamate dehydrogenase (NADP+)
VLTGKGLKWGGFTYKPEAQVIGCVYFAPICLKPAMKPLEGQVCLVSGSGQISQFTLKN